MKSVESDPSLESAMLRNVVGASISSLELIPLNFYKPGSLALVLYIVSEHNSCRSCPWHEYYGPSRVFDSRDIPASRIYKRFKELEADLLFISGGDILSRIDSLSILKALHSYGIRIGVKHYSKASFNPDSLRFLDAVLLEVRALSDLKFVDVFLENLPEHVHMEMIIDEISENIIDRLHETSWFRDLCRNYPRFYKAIYMADKDEKFIERYSYTLSKICENQFYIISSHHSFKPDEISCIGCGTHIGVRIDGVVIKPSIDGVTCPRCGFKIFAREYNRNRIRKRFIFSRVVL
ncbi:MAG: hypothetical protein QXJ51_05150 [Sulfolobales archaeon]